MSSVGEYEISRWMVLADGSPRRLYREVSSTRRILSHTHMTCYCDLNVAWSPSSKLAHLQCCVHTEVLPGPPPSQATAVDSLVDLIRPWFVSDTDRSDSGWRLSHLYIEDFYTRTRSQPVITIISSSHITTLEYSSWPSTIVHVVLVKTCSRRSAQQRSHDMCDIGLLAHVDTHMLRPSYFLCK